MKSYKFPKKFKLFGRTFVKVPYSKKRHSIRESAEFIFDWSETAHYLVMAKSQEKKE